jgi:hypothetical protein
VGARKVGGEVGSKKDAQGGEVGWRCRCAWTAAAQPRGVQTSHAMIGLQSQVKTGNTYCVGEMPKKA